MYKTIEFDRVADIYDFYVNVDFDVDFFLKEAKNAKNVLELTSGTGRVSLPLILAGVNLTCVDYSERMLMVLRSKIEKNHLRCQIQKMDITELSLGEKYDLIIIPFNSFSEIIETKKHKETLERVYDHLAENGVFICTLHNPEIRLKAIDGALRMMGRYPIQDDKTLILTCSFNYDPAGRIVSGIQFYEIYNGENSLVGKRYLDVKFYLFGYDEFRDLIETVGFQVAAVYGDYSYAGFDEASSPFMIWKLTKKAIPD